MQAPLAHAGLVPALTNDLLGVGFVWSRPSATTGTVYHRNEHVLETFYTLQLSPLMRLQPDVQVVWDAAFNPDPGPSLGLPVPVAPELVRRAEAVAASVPRLMRRDHDSPGSGGQITYR